MPRIVSFIGVMGSGKDYQAKKLVEKGYKQIDFKDALLDMCSDLLGYDVREDYLWFKTHLIGMRRPSNPLSESYFHTDTRDFRKAYPGMLTGREFLQRVGTETMRKRDKDYWAIQFYAKAKIALRNGFSVVNADCRFLNEVDHIHWLEGHTKMKFIFCDYRSDRYDPRVKHESERLAQTLRYLGLRNGNEITAEHFRDARELLEGK